MEQITKGCCVDCGFNSVCEEAKQNRIKCNEFYHTSWMAKEMERRMLNPISARDKKYFLKLLREKTAEDARNTLYTMFVIVVVLLAGAAAVTAGLWIPIVVDFIISVGTWADAHNINLGATILVIIGSIFGIWLVGNVVGSVLVLLRQNIREAKGMFKDIQPSTIYKVTCTCGNVIEFDYETLEKGFIICDKCDEHLEFHCEDDDEDDRT